MKNPSRLTSAIARELSQPLASRSIDVLYDHGDPALDSPHNLGQLATWLGENIPLSTFANCHSQFAIMRASLSAHTQL